MLIGVTLGLIAGYRRGWVDSCMARGMDIVLAFPVLVLAIGIGVACSGAEGCVNGLIQPGLNVVIVVIVIASWPYVARLVRGQVLSLREKEFVEASRSLGAIRQADHLPRDPPEPHRAADRLRDDPDPAEHPLRGRAVVPRASASTRRSRAGGR